MPPWCRTTDSWDSIAGGDGHDPSMSDEQCARTRARPMVPVTMIGRTLARATELVDPGQQRKKSWRPEP